MTVWQAVARQVQLYENDAELAGGPCDQLVFRDLQATDDAHPCVGRVDDVVDQRLLRGEVGIDLRADGGDQILPKPFPRLAWLGGANLAAEQDVDRALRSHDRYLRCRPADNVVRSVLPAAHHVVPSAVGLAQDDGDLRHRGAGN